MNAILTLNFGRFLCPNAEASHRDAAARWGCDYVQAHGRLWPHLFASWEKFFRVLLLENYERVMYLDADCLIRHDAPSPFHTFPMEAFVAVADLSPRYTPRLKDYAKKHVIENWIPELVKRHGSVVDLKAYTDKFFNGGWFVASPVQHRKVFNALVEAAESLTPDDRLQPGVCEEGLWGSYGWHEQAVFNWLVQQHIPEALWLANETWNFVAPDLSRLGMKAFIYHFTGFGWNKPGGPDRSMIQLWDWKTSYSSPDMAVDLR